MENSLEKQIKILFLASTPNNMSKLRLDEEFQAIRNSLAENTHFEIEYQSATKPDELLQKIFKSKPTIIHFSGLGEEETGGLYFEDEYGNSKYIPPEALDSLFSLTNEFVRCVIINASYSEKQAISISEYIPVVVGTKKQISDAAAIKFSIGFYTALSSENNLTIQSFKNAFNSGSIAVRFENLSEELLPILLEGKPEIKFAYEIDIAFSSASQYDFDEFESIRSKLALVGKKLGLSDDLTSNILNNKIEGYFQNMPGGERVKKVIPEKLPYQNLYQPFFLAEGNHRDTVDQLDFENDYNSFASVICLKKMKPPLAIGLFGNWGSGKSFFMQKLSERITKIADAKEPESIENVVQVWFNSWHYSDANLWASLTTQLFESLNDYATKKKYGPEAIKLMYKDLNITNLQLEVTQKNLNANLIQENTLKEQKANVEEAIRVKKEKLSLWTAKDLLRVVFSDPYIQRDFENIKKQFNDEKLIDNIDQIDEQLNKVDTVWGQLSESFALLGSMHRKWIWVWTGLIIVFMWLVVGPFKQRIQQIINDGVVITSLILSWVSVIMTKLLPYFNKVNQFYRRLKSLKATIDIEKEKVKLIENDEVIRLNREINDLLAAKTELELKQTQVLDRKEKLENELKEIGSGKLLANFLAGRSADDAYLKQLGIISWVRRDFNKLNELFIKQQSVRENEQEITTEVQIDRIVLFIDDLDRCNEDIVVKVLEAIHLLLAFPLFVVVVGVDPRWLNNALSQKYKNLFNYNSGDLKGKNSDRKTGENEELLLSGIATSYDYLEKIFQIPFALKPITEIGREKLIQYLIKDEINGNVSAAASSDVEERRSSNDNDTYESDDNSFADQQIKIEKERTINKMTEEKHEEVREVKHRLIFTAEESKYMKHISSVFGQTPRMINRYINIYRIIKAHGSLKVEDDFSSDDFMPIMLILAIIVGYSTVAEQFVKEIERSTSEETFSHFRENSQLPNQFKIRIRFLSNPVNNLPMKKFKANLELISRFSFRTIL